MSNFKLLIFPSKKNIYLLTHCLDEYVSQFKFTVLLMPNGPQKITGLPFEPELYKSEHEIKDVEIQVCLLFFMTHHAPIFL